MHDLLEWNLSLACLSVIIPVYSGEDTLQALCAELERVRDQWGSCFSSLKLTEAIFVNDGCIDRSGDILRELEAKHPWVRVVTLSRNFGQHPATVAGILQTSGDWIATIDEDLQHPPAMMLDLLEAGVVKGCDVVYARPQSGVHRSFFRDNSSRLFKLGIRFLSGNNAVSNFNSFRVIRGSVARAAAAVSANETYFDVALSWFTESVATVRLNITDHRFATKRKSGYSLYRLFSHAGRLLFTSQTRWLRVGAFIGFLALFFSFGLGAMKLVQWAIDPKFVEVPGWASLFTALVFFGGLNSFLIGIMLEYVSVLLAKALGKPSYFTVDRSGDAALEAAIREYRSEQSK